MSHFSVLVITDCKPSDGDLAAILQPWHEFESTGCDDQYVVDIDRTAEAMEAFGNASKSRLKAPDGSLHSFFDENGALRPEFSRVDGDGVFASRTYFVPAGYERVEVPASEVETAAQWISEYYGWSIAGQGDGDAAKYGFIEVDGDGNVVRCIDRTNPNKKWDWWSVGGRWSGLLRLKEHATPELGRPGILGARADDHPRSSDVALVRDVDIATMRSEAEAKAGALWDKANAAVKDCPPIETFEAVAERHNKAYEAARNEYWSQPALVALKAAFPDSFFLTSEIDAISVDRDTFTNSAAASALCTFAVVKDGQWYERGEMGWFGWTTNEKDKDAWSAEFAKLLDGLPETACLTVVDCHI